MRFLFLVFLPSLLLSQFQFQGSFRPLGMVNIKDGSEISLPFRIATLDVGYTFGNIDFIANSALETKWSDSDYFEPQLREAYLAYYPYWGELRVGKQIHTWGIADGNNPTDNINAYDYYYMFSPDTERKLGNLSLSANYYLEDWQLQAILIPEHIPNRIVIDEPNFPFSKTLEKLEAMNIKDVANPLEFGFSGSTTLGENDITISYFNGYDRGFSFAGTGFGYKNSQMVGFNLLGFWDELTYRCELAFFDTENASGDISAHYYQGVYQVEYTTNSDVLFNFQFINQTVFSTKGSTINANGDIEPLTKDNFLPGMGTPFAMFSNQSILFSTKYNYLDDALELSAIAFVNLDDTEYMLGGIVNYTMTDNFKIESSITQFIGDDGIFASLEESFSHIKFGVKYSY